MPTEGESEDDSFTTALQVVHDDVEDFNPDEHPHQTISHTPRRKRSSAWREIVSVRIEKLDSAGTTAFRETNVLESKDEQNKFDIAQPRNSLITKQAVGSAAAQPGGVAQVSADGRLMAGGGEPLAGPRLAAVQAAAAGAGAAVSSDGRLVSAATGEQLRGAELARAQQAVFPNAIQSVDSTLVTGSFSQFSSSQISSDANDEALQSGECESEETFAAPELSSSPSHSNVQQVKFGYLRSLQSRPHNDMLDSAEDSDDDGWNPVTVMEREVPQPEEKHSAGAAQWESRWTLGAAGDADSDDDGWNPVTVMEREVPQPEEKHSAGAAQWESRWTLGAAGDADSDDDGWNPVTVMEREVPQPEETHSAGAAQQEPEPLWMGREVNGATGDIDGQGWQPVIVVEDNQ